MKFDSKKYYKVIKTNDIIEIMSYEKLNVRGGPPDTQGIKKGEGKDILENYSRTQKYRRDMIRRLITQNFKTEGSKFVTLTFKNGLGFDIKDVKECNRQFKKFIQRLKYRYPNLKYVAVIEFQDKNSRNAVHYHIICNLPYIKKIELADIWGLGFVHINSIDNVDNLGAYVVKYMNKDLDDLRLQGLKAYNCSKGLERPIEFKSWCGVHEFMDLKCIIKDLEEKKPVYEKSYTSEHAGDITYSQYNLSRDSL